MNNHGEHMTAQAGSGKIFNHVATSLLPTRHGEFRIHVYQPVGETVEHVAIVRGEPGGQERVLVRVHSECLTGDVLGSLRCDCGEQLDAALARIAEEGLGVVVYLRGHEGRGIGLANKIRAYQLQDQGQDTVEANLALGLPVDTRDYQVAAQILGDLGIRTIRLMTNNPKKMKKLADYGTQVVERVPVQMPHTPHNIGYLRTKQKKLGHMLDFEQD
ncbi:MAG TPA: GTP cyclohydrolase II [Noviherbaspirillum sp.]|uniref:GTP cyclohydrolase II n=1 Tax=Noviherbaspirillum sp. TaxID=1926288 RepID=UPI002D4E6FE2|nr:GTP cyclohydrolase II [Noviherbaspirillum sp.]HYD94434.1 GTP cyclohydrolase II [Noviherbaspirillum sp.]